jgi:putative ATP-dependent endonuclease of the OLD family
MSSTTIYHLTIERFRGIQTLSWSPNKGLNVILGGGDVGKTTILDAIALLFSPTNPTTVPDTDYFQRDIESGFTIEAIVALPSVAEINYQPRPTWPWDWDGKEAIVPSPEKTPGTTDEPAYRLRVRGTSDLELAYEILQPDGTTDVFYAGLRRAIGLVRLSGDDRNDRDLRLVQGSALDRLLSDKGLRSRLASELAKSDVKDQFSDEAKNVLKDLDSTFSSRSLPTGLDLAITGSPGSSVAALIGVTAKSDAVQLPLASWGAGTRRLAALAIAERNQSGAPITLVDEVERGLEPYRQRALVETLQSGTSQVFITTHSPTAISAASKSVLWYVDRKGRIGQLEQKKVEAYVKTDPEMFLARLAIVAEGATEFGFVTALLERSLRSPLDQFGVHVTDGGGHEKALDLLEALGVSGLQFGGFVDDEQKHETRWANLASKLGKLLFRWNSGCLEENIIGLVLAEKFEALLIDPSDEKTGMRLRTLADRLDIREKNFETIKAKAGPGLKELIVAAALGKVPADKQEERRAYRSHAQTWFKSAEGGRELADKVFSLDLWPAVRMELIPFCNAVCEAIGVSQQIDLEP